MESSAKWAPDILVIPKIFSREPQSCFLTPQSRVLFMPDQTINRLSLPVLISVYPCQDSALSLQLPASCFCFSTQSSVLSGAYCLAKPHRQVAQRRAGGNQSYFFPVVSKMFPCNTKNLAITIPYRWKQPASKPLVFPSVSMADEKRIVNRTQITLPSWKHTAGCFHDVPKKFPWP